MAASEDWRRWLAASRSASGLEMKFLDTKRWLAGALGAVNQRLGVLKGGADTRKQWRGVLAGGAVKEKNWTVNGEREQLVWVRVKICRSSPRRSADLRFRRGARELLAENREEGEEEKGEENRRKKKKKRKKRKKKEEVVTGDGDDEAGAVDGDVGDGDRRELWERI